MTRSSNFERLVRIVVVHLYHASQRLHKCERTVLRRSARLLRMISLKDASVVHFRERPLNGMRTLTFGLEMLTCASQGSAMAIIRKKANREKSTLSALNRK